jgi:hypothetical protein
VKPIHNTTLNDQFQDAARNAYNQAAPQDRQGLLGGLLGALAGGASQGDIANKLGLASTDPSKMSADDAAPNENRIQGGRRTRAGRYRRQFDDASKTQSAALPGYPFAIWEWIARTSGLEPWIWPHVLYDSVYAFHFTKCSLESRGIRRLRGTLSRTRYR